MKILFQGDSITDAGRDRSDPHKLSGYTAYTAQLLGKDNEYVNLGISGNRTCDLLQRYDCDFKAVKPDVLTVLIGINDLWRAFDSGDYTSPEQYKKNYGKLLSDFKRDVPGAKIIILEPYLLPCPEKAYWRPMLADIIAAARAIAVEYADGFIPLDGLFAKQALVTPWNKLSADGVHPVDDGEKMIARYLAEEIKRFL